ncbi:MAG: flavodoxin [Clostridiales Family XIII bacterium]|jgi:flavodoxin|nr:flavodoxin [Clostridiales Family XIII bacterium]
MNIEIRYLSKSGNTKKVADAIADALDLTPKPITEAVGADTDVLFLGGAVYGFGIDEALKTFIRNLPNVKIVAVFSTTAVVKSAFPHIKSVLDEKAIPVAGAEFHCRGAFSILHKGRPNATDLKRAGEFARDIVATYGK